MASSIDFGMYCFGTFEVVFKSSKYFPFYLVLIWFWWLDCESLFAPQQFYRVQHSCVYGSGTFPSKTGFWGPVVFAMRRSLNCYGVVGWIVYRLDKINLSQVSLQWNPVTRREEQGVLKVHQYDYKSTRVLFIARLCM